ncbi:glycoside hydrolase family 16 protein [Aplosporella prunicola CBS 121167]|uniref:Glycoside hydrolase family 16 protein n=1 Tax=Aplosporella prunicola CBS 121167 TaxID=1176127 RepID=A0A6A6BAX9_9PEZI|nr:glycoside hydrolase family 16 protein [Aplosporella prunicola CBS 121167]KAF2141402.1 glycoside hydrolase family 16 protein [Aplosporella prunicola CBS 121167]
MPSPDPSSPPATSPSNATPHIRLNSASTDLVVGDPPAVRPAPSRQISSRSLTSDGASTGGQSALVYGYPGPVAESAEFLIPPRVSRTRRFRDEDSPSSMRSPSGISSRRTSWSSDSGTSRDSRMGPFVSPFDDTRTPSRAGSDEENINTQTVSEKYNIMPSPGLLLFPEDVEKDDWLHNPDPDEKDTRDCDIFNRRGALNMGGLAILTIGLLMLFIGYPVLTFAQKLLEPQNACSSNPDCIDVHQDLLKNIRHGLIDKDTPENVKTRKSVYTGKKQTLVFSDEFNVDGRTFYDEDDPYFQAVDIWYGVTQDLEWYDPDAVITKDGTLNIRFDAHSNHDLEYRSGMVQSWNKLCFKGGHLEASISLPGRGDTVGFWPGFWAMGNLGRPGYAATTDGMWPYTYDDTCDAGITPNQSSSDGINYLPGMKLPACTCRGQDHPNPGKSRSAPEIDVIEASNAALDEKGNFIGVVSQSAQLAPFDVWYHPDYDFMEVYDHSITSINSYAGGPYQQAISGLTNLNNDWYDGKAYQKYAFDYTPGSDGHITWFVGDAATWTLDARAVAKNGNIAQRVIPEEPMSIIINFGMSDSFSAINLTGITSTLPATMRLDYIRIYQDEDNPIMTCDPPGYPTTGYIKNHPEPYANINLTQWSQTDYVWPKNSLTSNCDT